MFGRFVSLCAMPTLVFVIVVTAGPSLLAQTTTATISGRAVDQSGAVMPGVSVTLSHLETGETRTTLTDDAGRYRVPQLALGEYEVRAELSGFKTVVRSGITLTVRREAVVELVLEVGSVIETVEVTGEAPLVNTRNAVLSGLVDDRAIAELPLNGRSFDNLITLSAGTFFHQNRERLIGAGPGNYFSVSGLQPAMNRFTLDGTEYSGVSAVSTTPGGVSGQTLGLDAIREFEVLKNSYSAEFGKRGGAQINIITKSGANRFHGSAFEFLRNDNLDARNFFDRDPNNPLERSDPPEFKRNSFGGTLGGPIVTNKTFFFGAYEGFREREGLTLIGIVPDENARMGLLPDPDNPGQFRDVGVAPAVRPFLDALYPLPNGRNFGDGTAEILSSPASAINEDFFTARIDHNFSDRDFLFGRYTFDDGDLVRPDTRGGNPFVGLTMVNRNQVFTLEETHIFSPTVINVFRFGFTRSRLFSDEGSLIDIPPALTFVEGREMGRLRIGGGTGRAQSALSDAGNSGVVHDTALVSNKFTYYDQLNISRGSHSITAGTEIQRIQENPSWSLTFRGSMFFTSLENFLLGMPAEFNAPVAGAFGKSLRHTLFGFFLQDDVNMTRNLTLNLGIRYEFLTTIKDSREGGKTANWLRVASPRGPLLETTPRVSPSAFTENNSLKGVAPRIGLAWDPFGAGKTSVRAGFGLFYDQLDNLGFVHRGVPEPPFTLARRFVNPPFPRPFEVPGVIPTVSPNGIDDKADVPTIVQYSFTIQHEITPATVFTIGYVGSSGYHIIRNTTPNSVFPEFLPDGRKFFPAGAPRRNPELGGGGMWLTDANSSYNSLQLELTQRATAGLRFKAAYTYSKNIDTNAGKITEETPGGANQPMDPDDIKRERSLASWDVPHNLAFNFTYDLPLGQGLLGGWQLTGIATVTAGPPVTPRNGFNNSRNRGRRDAGRPNLLPGADSNPALGSPDKWFDPTVFSLPDAGTYGNLGRNTLRMDGGANLDFSIFKNTAIPSISEDFNVQLRAEFFNIFNHAQFGVPDLLLFTPGGGRRGAAGQVRRTVTTSRQIQFGLKFIF